MGYWRRRMKQRFGRYKPKYGQRWQVETVNSMVKRRLGSALRARKYQSQCRETMLRAITHNVMIVRLRVFYRATRDWISLRRAHSSLRRGTLLDLDAGPDHYLFARRDATETVVIAFNRSDKPVSASFTSSALEARAGVALVHLLGVGEATHVQGEQVALMLPPCSVAAYQVR